MSKPFSTTTKTTMKITLEEVILIRNAVNQAFQAGADQELEACCEWVQGYAECGDSLRAARRSLKQLDD